MQITYTQEIKLPFFLECDETGCSKIEMRDGKYYLVNVLQDKIISDKEISEKKAIETIKECFEINRSDY